MKNELKSQFFSKNEVTVSEKFANDVKTMSNMQPGILARVPDFAFKALECLTNAEANKIYDAAAKELKVPRAQLDHVLDVAGFFLRELAPKGDAASDDPEALVSDLNEHFGVPCAKNEDLLSFFRQLKKLAEGKLRLTLLQRAHSESTLPILQSVSAQVDIRAVFDEAYNYDQAVSEYSPKFLCTVPLGIVRLKLSGAHNEEVFMQLSRRSLQALIDHLVALQKQIDVAETRLTVKEG